MHVFACFLNGPNVITLADRMEGLFWDGEDDYLKKTSSMCKPLLFSLSVWHRGHWGKTPRSCKSLGTQAWPESWTPTHGDTFMLMKMMVWAIMKLPLSQVPLPPTSLVPPCLSHLWAEMTVEKSPAYQSSSSTWMFWKVCGKMVLALCKLSLWRCRGLPKIRVIWGYYLSFPLFLSPLKWLCPLLWSRTQLTW